MSTTFCKSLHRLCTFYFYILGLVLIWLGSIIASLWANVYEDILKYFFHEASSHTSSSTAYSTTRGILLITLSVAYVLFMKFATVSLVRSLTEKIKKYIREINLENLRYIPPSPRSLVL